MIVNWIRSIKLSELYEELKKAKIIGDSYTCPEDLFEYMFDEEEREIELVYYYYDLNPIYIYSEFHRDIAKFITNQIGESEFVMIYYDC